MPKKSLEQLLPVLGDVLQPLQAAAREQDRARGELALDALRSRPLSASRMRSPVTPMTRTRCPRNSSASLREPRARGPRRGCGRPRSASSAPRAAADRCRAGRARRAPRPCAGALRARAGRTRSRSSYRQCRPSSPSAETSPKIRCIFVPVVCRSGSRDRSSAAPRVRRSTPVAARIASKNDVCPGRPLAARPREEAELAGRAGRVEHDHPVLVEALEPAVDGRRRRRAGSRSGRAS